MTEQELKAKLQAKAEDIVRRYNDYAQTHLPSDCKMELSSMIRHALEAVEKERDEAKACCAEMRTILKKAYWIGWRDYDGGLHHQLNASPTEVDHALSSDCGKDFRRISDFKPLAEALKYCLEESVYTQESCGANIAKAAQEAIALARKLGIERLNERRD